ncbi:cystatin-B [Bombina bombina]|uniref:cystatin-B n=1 Tax=Bombina bombina TaxID=8345 RepID=UPI00235B23CB|nr:cystatin-B [Bombina bombina]
MALPGGLAGGLGNAHPATPEVQAIADKVRSDIEKQSGKNFGKFIVVSFKTQVVAGTNYFIKIQVGGNEYFHVRIHESLPHDGKKVTLSGFKECKTKEEEIGYF